jgi:CRP/FNR family cyclic AMP-dependent transcriptional regulator
MGRSLTGRRRLSSKAQGGTACSFSAGARIFDPDHPARRIYQVKAGHVQLWSGPNAIVDQLAPGDFLGEKCLLPPRPSDQIAKALTPVVATAYRRSELFHCFERDRRFAQRLLKNLASRLDRYEHSIQDLVTEGAERRLARFLFRFIPTRRATGWIRLPLRGNNAELGRMVGMTRWRVSHFLNHFQRLGWLKRHQQELWVQCNALKAFLKSPSQDVPRSV